MKIAVLSDIHGHLHGFNRVLEDIEAWQPDIVIVNGDTINRGPNNRECWESVQEKAQTDGWIVLRGNHEDYVLKVTDPKAPTSGKAFELFQLSRFTYEQIKAYILDINALPDRYAVKAPDGSQMLVMHGTVLGNRVGVMPDTEDDELARRIAPSPAVFVTAHTHRPLIREIGETKVINVGSAGIPFDRDRRVSYGRITWTKSSGWQPKLERLSYDYHAAEQAFYTENFIPDAGPFSRIVMVEHRMARGLLHKWHKEYEEAWQNDELTFSQTVDKMLSEEELLPFAEGLVKS